jgi:hypothetical protein
MVIVKPAPPWQQYQKSVFCACACTTIAGDHNVPNALMFIDKVGSCDVQMLPVAAAHSTARVPQCMCVLKPLQVEAPLLASLTTTLCLHMPLLALISLSLQYTQVPRILNPVGHTYDCVTACVSVACCQVGRTLH